MKYTVILTPEAQANISEAYRYIAERSPLNAVRWVRGLYQSVNRLETFPRRCGHAREQAHFSEEIRHLIYKPYRIIFTINDATRTVSVVQVRHSKRRTTGEPPGEGVN